MSADAGGHPYIASYWRDPDSDVPQYRIVWHDGQMWHSRQVSGRTTPFSLKGGGTKMIPMARPRIVVDGGEIFYVFRDEERGSKVSLAHATDVANSKWSISDLTDFAVDAWERLMTRNCGRAGSGCICLCSMPSKGMESGLWSLHRNRCMYWK